MYAKMQNKIMKFTAALLQIAPLGNDQKTFTSQHRRVHRGVLQSAAVALCAGLPIPRRIRAKGRRSGRISGCTDGVFCEQRERRKDFERAAGDGKILLGKMGVRTAMCGKITRQSRWNLSPAVRVRQYRTKPRKIEEGVETGWRASRYAG